MENVEAFGTKFNPAATVAYDEVADVSDVVDVEDQLAVIGRVDPVPIKGCFELTSDTTLELFQKEAVMALNAHDELRELLANEAESMRVMD